MPAKFLVPFLFAGIALSQPIFSGTGPVNSANYLPACAANGGVAQGSVFVIFGAGLGPSDLQQRGGFPLEPSLAGTSIRVSVNGMSVEALPLYTSTGQVAAVLPSRTPAGNGTLTLSYNGRTSSPIPIKVMQNAFGIYTLNQTGSGQAVVQNVEGTNLTINSPQSPARPGQVMVLWGTGLGPVTGDESAGPLPNQIPNQSTGSPVTVWVGNERASVIYAGRSGCCAGLDQIIFEVPAGVEGCYVPLAVEAGGISSNYTSIAVSRVAPSCGDPLPPARETSPVSIGGILLADIDFQALGLPAFRGQVFTASFDKVTTPAGAPLNRLTNTFLGGPALPPGTCQILPPDNRDVSLLSPRRSGDAIGLDAGASLRVTGPNGEIRIPSIGKGEYEFGSERNTFTTGRYRIDNGAGGTDVGGFAFETEAAPPRWTSPPDRVVRAEDLTLTWTPGSEDGLVAIAGASPVCDGSSVAFVCYQRASAGRMTIPSRILRQLPASAGGGPGSLTLTGVNPNPYRSFTAPGLHTGLFLLLNLQYRQMVYE